MKMKALAALCKNECMFLLYDLADENGEIYEQWLGVSGAAFPLQDMPILSENHIITIFDLTSKQLETITIKRSPANVALNFDHRDDAEIRLGLERNVFSYKKYTLMPLKTRNGVDFINADYLEPLKDIADNLELYERRTTDGQTYFAAKMGFMIVGIIMPQTISEDFVEYMENLASKSRVALTHQKERTRFRSRMSGEQVTNLEIESQ